MLSVPVILVWSALEACERGTGVVQGGLSPVQGCVWTHVSKEPHIVGPHHADRSVCDLQDTEDARLADQQVRSHAPGRGGERLARRRP